MNHCPMRHDPGVRQEETPVSRHHLSRLLRAASYMALLFAIAWGLRESLAPVSRPACVGMACVGAGLGDAILFLLIVCGAFLLCTLLNVMAFLLHTPPRSIARKVELLLFMLPLALLAGLLFSLISF